MVNFSEAWDFFLLLIFGAVVVGVHAQSLFGQKLTDSKTEKSEDPLTSLSLPAILGPSDYRRGFTVYLLANELLYLILTSSSTILALVLEAVGHQKMVGALTEDVTPNVLYPILASSLVVLMSQTKPTSGIERTFRRIAHGIAGMPRNLEETQARIRVMDLVNDSPSLRKTRNIPPIVQSAKAKTDAAVTAASLLLVEDLEVHNLRRSLEKVHCLFPWTLGYDGECIWISENTRQITSLFRPLELEYFRLSNEVDLLVRLSENRQTINALDQDVTLEKENHRERWRSVIASIQLLEQRLSIVVSLLLINQPDVDLSNYPALNDVRDFVMTKSQPDEPSVSNIALHTIFLGGTFTFMSLLIVDVSVRLWRQITTVRSGQSIEFPRLPDLGFFSRLLDIPAAFLNKTGKLEYISGSVGDSLIQLIDYSLIFGTAMLIALFIRQSQIDLRRWHTGSSTDTKMMVTPITSYFLIGVVAYCITSVNYFLWRFAVHNFINPLQNGVDINVQLTIRNFGNYLPGIGLESLVVFPCVWFVLSYADRSTWKNGGFADTAIWYASVCAVIVFLQKLLRFDFQSSTSLFEVPASPFIAYCILFIAFARVYELHKNQTNKITFMRRTADVLRHTWLRMKPEKSETPEKEVSGASREKSESVHE